MIKFDFNLDQIKGSERETIKIEQIFDKKRDMLGWFDIDDLFNEELITDINQTKDKLKEKADVLLVIGVGGSYLGALALIESLNPYFYNDIKKPKVYFLGSSLSSEYYHDLINIIKDQNIIVNVVSQSGKTTEIKLIYQLVMDFMRKKYGNDLKDRIIITTGENSPLIEEAKANNYKLFIIKNNIPGRYSVFTPSGLLAAAVMDVDLKKLYQGVKQAHENFEQQINYALIRKEMIDKGKKVEAYVIYEPKLKAFAEWFQQLYAESLGKNNQGLLPIIVNNTKDLHSLGQYIQDGDKILFETVFKVKKVNKDLYLPFYQKSFNEINNLAADATTKAHRQEYILNNIIEIEEINEFTIGYLMQFFMTSCVISAHLEKVNPFNQDAVEKYKKELLTLLNENH